MNHDETAADQAAKEWLEKVTRTVDTHLHMYKEMLGLDNWTITMLYHDGESSATGYCDRLYAYKKAWIFIDPAKHVSKSAVLQTLRHELLHLVHTPFDLAYEVMAKVVGVEKGSREHDTFQEIYTYAQEATVVNMERMLAKLVPDLEGL